MFNLEDNLMEPEEMLGYPTINNREEYYSRIQTSMVPEEPKVLIDERDTVATKCPSCHIMQEDLKQCNSCHQYIPSSAIRTLIKSNGQICNITGLNPVYCHLPQPPEPDRVKHCHIENAFKSKKEVPVFFHHPDNSFRESLKDIARSAIRKLKNNEDTVEQKMIKRCTFEKYWRYCSRCNPELWHVNKTGGKGKCTKDDLRDGLEFIMDHMEFSEEEKEESKERVQLKNKMKNSMHPHRHKVRYSDSGGYSSSEEQRADIKEKKKTVGDKTHVASNKLSDINYKKSQFVAATKTVGTTLKKKDNDSVQNVNMLKKQRKDAKVTFIASNKLHSTDKSAQFMNASKFVDLSQTKSQTSASSKKLDTKNESQERPDMIKDPKLSNTSVKEGEFMNATKFVGLPQAKSQTSPSSKKLNINNESQERPDMIKDTKLPYSMVKEGQFINMTKTAGLPKSKNFDPASSRKQTSVNIKKEREHLFYSMAKEYQLMHASKNVGLSENKNYNSASSRTQTTVNIKKEVFKVPDVRNIPSYKTNKNQSDNILSITPPVERKPHHAVMPHAIRATFVQKIIPKDSVSTSKNIQTSSKTFFDHKKKNLDTGVRIPVMNETKPKSMLSSSEKFSEKSKNVSFDRKEANKNADNLSSTKNENTASVMSSSSKTYLETSSKTFFDHKKTNLDTGIRIPVMNETKPKSMLSSSEKFSKLSGSLASDQKKTNLDIKRPMKNENETVIPSFPGKASGLSGNLASDQKNTNLDNRRPMKNENENKITVIPSLSGKVSELSGNLASDQKKTNLDIKRPMKNENKITVIPSLPGKASELSGNLASDQNKTNLDIKRPTKNENENEKTVIPSLSGKLSENTQKPLKKWEYPSVSPEDLKCLPEKNLLNDTIIEFYLKYIFNEKLTPELQEKTYICNTFFYPKVLTQLNGTDKTKAKSVESWLKNIDLFSKDFILIPVNVEFSPKVKHWYLVIICFLSKIEKTPLYGADSGTTACDTGTQSVLQQKSSNSGDTDKRPCFCFFDSAYAEKCLGEKKLKVAKNLKNFLKTLWLSTHKYETCDWTQLISFNVKCPQQNNWYDCGIFLLQFAESFFQTPITKFQNPIDVTHWFDQSMITEKRKEIKKIIVEKMRDNNLKTHTPFFQDYKP